ncbi:MAG: hypothetical protein ACREC6_04315 [Hyphomicrobiaceae bacterium]
MMHGKNWRMLRRTIAATAALVYFDPLAAGAQPPPAAELPAFVPGEIIVGFKTEAEAIKPGVRPKKSGVRAS